jgi:sulfatase modifying factor 1
MINLAINTKRLYENVVGVVTMIILVLIFQNACTRETGRRCDASSESLRDSVDGSTFLRKLDWAETKLGSSYTSDGYPIEVVHKATSIAMVYIPPGSFMMGGGNRHNDEELPQHEVLISRGFYMSRFEITNKVYRSWKNSHDSTEFNGKTLNAENQPAVLVSWIDATQFCEALDFRLPTEAEWEYAARAGVATKYPWGNDPEDGLGWCNVADVTTSLEVRIGHGFRFTDGFGTTAPVGSFRANSFGLHDMIGNVVEWCSDWYSASYYESPSARTNPTGPVVGRERVIRGGSWNLGPLFCGLATRSKAKPTTSGDDTGFRVCKGP